ncbi:hypothetical protein L1987_20093 [Smallanthus sonchifolius]|uniref:Uncharacterized protein n=1 Tax=Smallanthus sonchifolius TaxID=185202 RepID=A0ACB9IS45_9ASTR|nr:hypothetical protein L1987_20093 [Smallanthus sonchifolius]
MQGRGKTVPTIFSAISPQIGQPESIGAKHDHIHLSVPSVPPPLPNKPPVRPFEQRTPLTHYITPMTGQPEVMEEEEIHNVSV